MCFVQLLQYEDCLSNLNINIPSKLCLSFTCCALILLFYLFVDVCFDMVDIDHQLYGGTQNRLWVGILHFNTIALLLRNYITLNSNTYTMYSYNL